MPVTTSEQERATPRRTQQYTSIQVLRALAALMVVLYHLPSALGSLDPGLPVLNSGVDLFFVISGAVMVLSTAGGRRDGWTFLAQRFTRIVPFYWVMTLLMAAALWVFAGRAVSLQEIADSLLFIPYRDEFTGYVQPVLGVGWTLNLEVMFYFLFAATMGLGKSKQMVAIGVVFATALTARLVFKPAADTVLFFYTTPILFEFLAGMALGHLVGRLDRFSAPLLACVVALGVASMLGMVLGLDLPRAIAQGIPALLIVAGCIGLERQFQRHAPPLLAGLGDASYSLYLIHPIVFLAAAPIISGSTLPNWIAGMAVLAACIIASLASYRTIERPLLAISRLDFRAYRMRA